MKRVSLAVLVAFAGLTLSTVGCGGSTPSSEPASPAGEGAQPAPAAMPSASTPSGAFAPAGDRPRLVAAVRGLAEIGYLKPTTRREKGEIITTFRVKNLATGPIAGLRVDEFWYDSEGNAVTGGQYRHREPFLQGEIIELQLRVPTNPRMSRPRWEFTHQNGDIRATLLETLDEPAPQNPS